MANKIKYGLSNVHYAKITETGGEITYGTVKAWPGAVNLSLSIEGEDSVFHADKIPYFRTFANNGYSGDLECALIPDDFRTDILGETLAGTYLVENANAIASKFAFGFQIEGDVNENMYWFYYCDASRPNVEAATKEDSIEPQTETISMTASPRPDNGNVRIRTSETSTEQEKAAWFTAVVEPSGE